MTLAEILAEGKRLNTAFQNACDFRSPVEATETIAAKHAFYIEHFPRLARVAEAVNEAIGDKLPTGSIPPCHRCTALRDALRAAVRGEEETNVHP